MDLAANEIRDLANNVLGRWPLLDVHLCHPQLMIFEKKLYKSMSQVLVYIILSRFRFFPNGGPAVGPAIRHQPRQMGQDLEAATCPISQ